MREFLKRCNVSRPKDAGAPWPSSTAFNALGGWVSGAGRVGIAAGSKAIDFSLPMAICALLIVIVLMSLLESFVSSIIRLTCPAAICWNGGLIETVMFVVSGAPSRKIERVDPRVFAQYHASTFMFDTAKIENIATM